MHAYMDVLNDIRYESTLKNGFQTAKLMFHNIFIDSDAMWNNTSIHADGNFQES